MAEPKAGSMTQLIALVQENTKKYLDYFIAESLQEPSYENGDGLPLGHDLPAEIQQARDAALEATDELHHLLLGPMGLLADCPRDQWLLLSAQYIIKHKIAAKVPVGGETSFEEISKATGLDSKDVTRFLRVAIARHVFHESRKGYIVHTAASRLLIDNPALEDWILMIAEEIWPSLTRSVAATLKWPGSEEPNEAGHALANNATEYPFDVIKKDPARLQRFASALRYSHMHKAYSMTYLLSGFDFSAVRTVVDIGGSHGEVAIALARKYANIEVVVQDLPDTIASLDAQVPADLKSRIKGVSHDFLTPQPTKGADVYLLRWILHDWSDTYCVKILRCLISGLKKGARVVVNDICIPEPGQLGIAAERSLRLMDISMKAFSNARERDAETWASLFATADPGYRFLGITLPEGARMAIIQAEWTGDERED